MSNVFIGLTNRITAATLKNGTGGGAPALIEQSPYLMSNLIGTDRYTVWKSSPLSNPTQYNIDFDLGGNKTLDALALLGHRYLVGSGISYDISYQTGAYNPVGVWTFVATLSVGQTVRDVGFQFGPVTARSVRFTAVPSGAGTVVTLGKFFAGDLTDLGGIGTTPGYEPYRNRSEISQPNGATVLFDVGDPGADFTLPWPSIPLATRATLLTIQGASGSFVMVDPDGAFFEVYAKGGRVSTARRFSTLFDANVELARMP